MRYTRKRVILGCCALLLLSCSQILAQDQSSGDIEEERGRNEASRDMKKGEFVIKSWGQGPAKLGTLPSSEHIYHSMLWERYKIQYEQLGGCFIDDDALRYVAGYNKVSIAGIEARYGKGLLTKVRKEAEAEYELKDAEQDREFMRRMIEALKTLPKTDN
jgi:hypothetical protein